MDVARGFPNRAQQKGPGYDFAEKTQNTGSPRTL